MSVDAPNSKQCPTPDGPKKVPRDPQAYRPTNHFYNRLKQRVPDELQDDIAARCIKHGHVSSTSPAGHCEGSVWQTYAFDYEIDDTEWSVIVGIVPQAYGSEMVKHQAITIYSGGGGQ